MKLDNAIRMALEYETGVHNTYSEASRKASDPSAKRILQVLTEEEMGHIQYLQERLDEWQSTGKINVKKLGTSIPTKEVINQSLQELRKTVKPKPTRLIPELELLKKALQVEVKTSNFYKEMVSKLDGEGQELFKRFLEIEQGHEAIVQAQIDSATGLGVFLDTLEFRLEAE